MAVATPPVAPTEGKPKRTPVPKPLVPEGLIGLSDLRAKKNDQYAAWRPYIGKRIIFQGVRTSDDKKTAVCDVFEYIGSKTPADGQTVAQNLPVPKAAVKALVNAIDLGKTDGLSALVVETARGIALQ